MLPIQLPLELGEDGKNFSNNSIKEETLQGFFASSDIQLAKESITLERNKFCKDSLPILIKQLGKE